MTGESPDMVSVPRASLADLTAAIKRLRGQVERGQASERIEARRGPRDDVRTLTRDDLPPARRTTE